MSHKRFHPLWGKILSQNLQAVADQGFHLEGPLIEGQACELLYLQENDCAEVTVLQLAEQNWL
jgi:hypothetical protein